MNTCVLINSLNQISNNFDTIVSLSIWINDHLRDHLLTKQKIKSCHERSKSLDEVIQHIKNIDILRCFSQTYNLMYEVSEDTARYILSNEVYEITPRKFEEIVDEHKCPFNVQKIFLLYYITKKVSYTENELSLCIHYYCENEFDGYDDYDFDLLENFLASYASKYLDYVEVFYKDIKVPKKAFKGLKNACMEGHFYVSKIFLKIRNYKKSKLNNLIEVSLRSENYLTASILLQMVTIDPKDIIKPALLENLILRYGNSCYRHDIEFPY